MTALSEIPTDDLRAELARRRPAVRISPDARLALDLIARAGKSYGLTPAQVMSKRRDNPHCHARWAVWASLAHAGWIPSRIAAVFAVDPGTIHNGLQQAGRRAATDNIFLGTLLLLRADLASGRPSVSPQSISNQ